MTSRTEPQDLGLEAANTVPQGIRWAWNASNVIMLLQVSPFTIFLLLTGGWYMIAGSLVAFLPVLNLVIRRDIADRSVRRLAQSVNSIAALPLLLGAYDSLTYKRPMPVSSVDLVGLELYASLLGLLGICVNLVCLAKLRSRRPFRAREPTTPD